MNPRAARVIGKLLEESKDWATKARLKGAGMDYRVSALSASAAYRNAARIVREEFGKGGK